MRRLRVGRRSGRIRVLAGGLLVIASVLAACGGGDKDRPPPGTSLASRPADPDDAAALPPAADLLTRAAAAMRTVNSTHFVLDTDRSVTSIPLRHADGDVARPGNVRATAALTQGGGVVEFDIVIVGDTLYLKGVTGSGYQPMPKAVAATVYDPSVLLDPDAGAASAIATAGEGRTEGRERVGGVDTYRIAVVLDRTAAAALVPGVTSPVNARLWIDADRYFLVRATLSMPEPRDAGGAITVSLSRINTPVAITPPR